MFTASGRTLKVGTNQTYHTLKDAVAASQPGDRIEVQAGTYTNDVSIIRHDLEIVGVGGRATFVATRPIDNGKAILVVAKDADVKIDNLGFVGATVADANGAGIRHEGGDLVVTRSLFQNNQNGILTYSKATATLTVTDSEFDHNGYGGNGRTHGIYAGGLGKVTVTGSYFHDTEIGHHIKSRAAETVIENNRIIDGATGTSSYSIDLPNGGVGIIRGNIIDQGPKGSNNTMIAYGAEGSLKPGSLLVEENTFTNAKSGSTIGVYNHTTVPVEMGSNSFTNLSKQVQGPSVPASHDSPPPAPVPATPAEPTPPAQPPVKTLPIKAGTEGADRLTGGVGEEKLLGHGGSDIIKGQGGNDQLDGGAGDDWLYGGGGDDLLTGGAGKDCFVYETKGHGRDRITDFKPGEDSISLQPLTKSLGLTTGTAIKLGYVKLVAHDGDMLIQLDADGAAGTGGAVTIMTVEDVGLTGLIPGKNLWF